MVFLDQCIWFTKPKNHPATKCYKFKPTKKNRPVMTTIEFWGKSLQKLYTDLNSYYCTIIHKSVFVHLLFDISVVFFNKQNSPPPFSLQNAFFPKKCQVSQTIINSTTRKSVGTTNRSMYPWIFKKPGLPYMVYLWIPRLWKALPNCKAGFEVYKSGVFFALENLRLVRIKILDSRKII